MSDLSRRALAEFIGTAYFVTSSTSFANPAVTVAPTLTDDVLVPHPQRDPEPEEVPA